MTSRRTKFSRRKSFLSFIPLECTPSSYMSFAWRIWQNSDEMRSLHFLLSPTLPFLLPPYLPLPLYLLLFLHPRLLVFFFKILSLELVVRRYPSRLNDLRILLQRFYHLLLSPLRLLQLSLLLLFRLPPLAKITRKDSMSTWKV